MTSPDGSKALNRILKLLAHSRGGGTTTAEAETALALAQKLMVAHKIPWSEVEGRYGRPGDEAEENTDGPGDEECQPERPNHKDRNERANRKPPLTPEVIAVSRRKIIELIRKLMEHRLNAMATGAEVDETSFLAHGLMAKHRISLSEVEGRAS